MFAMWARFLSRTFVSFIRGLQQIDEATHDCRSGIMKNIRKNPIFQFRFFSPRFILAKRSFDSRIREDKSLLRLLHARDSRSFLLSFLNETPNNNVNS